MCMKTFEFVAFDSSGKKRAGIINAWGLSEAKRKIQQKGFYLASIKIRDGLAGYGVTPTKLGIKGEGVQETSGSGVATKREGI